MTLTTLIIFNFFEQINKNGNMLTVFAVFLLCHYCIACTTTQNVNGSCLTKHGPVSNLCATQILYDYNPPRIYESSISFQYSNPHECQHPYQIRQPFHHSPRKLALNSNIHRDLPPHKRKQPCVTVYKAKRPSPYHMSTMRRRWLTPTRGQTPEQPSDSCNLFLPMN